MWAIGAAALAACGGRSAAPPAAPVTEDLEPTSETQPSVWPYCSGAPAGGQTSAGEGGDIPSDAIEFLPCAGQTALRAAIAADCTENQSEETYSRQCTHQLRVFGADGALRAVAELPAGSASGNSVEGMMSDFAVTLDSVRLSPDVAVLAVYWDDRDMWMADEEDTTTLFALDNDKLVEIFAQRTFAKIVSGGELGTWSAEITFVPTNRFTDIAVTESFTPSAGDAARNAVHRYRFSSGTGAYVELPESP